MSSTHLSRLLELGETINKCTQKLHDCLAANALPFPSFEADGRTGLPGLPVQLVADQDALIDATRELSDLMLPPRNLLQYYGSDNNLVCMQAIVRFDIAGQVPLDGNSITYASLASRVGLDEQTLRRLIRHAITMRIFTEKSPDSVSHTSVSKKLIDAPMRAWLETGSKELWPAATKVVDALTRWPGSGEPTETGFALASGTQKSIYDVFAIDSQRVADFGAAMEIFATSPEMSLSHLTSHSIWSDCKTVVDIGGSMGHAAIALAKKHAGLTITVEDLPPVVANAQTHVPEEIAERVKFVAHDFIADGAVQPVIGADVYLLRWILHNWSDKYASAIFKSIIPALKQGARILIMEIILPEPGAVPLYKEKDLRSMDMAMLALFNAKERSLKDWEDLLNVTDQGLKLVGVTEPKGSALGLLEVQWLPKKPVD